MKGLLWSLFLFLFFSSAANAEYYFSANNPVSNTVTINCRGHHCSFKTKHYTKYHYKKPSARMRRMIEEHCNQDRATGDDMACLYPDLQIN